MSIGRDGIIEPTEKKSRGRPRDTAKQQAIIAAAQRLFLQHGFEAVSMDAIADAAGVAKATVYARFKDKEALLQTAIIAKCSSFMDEATLAPRPGQPLAESLMAIARRFLALITDSDAVRMHGLMLNEGERHPQLPDLFFRTAIEPTKAKVVAFLRAEMDSGRLDIPDPEMAAWQFLSMVKGEAHMRALLHLDPREPSYTEAYLADCVDLFLAARSRGTR